MEELIQNQGVLGLQVSLEVLDVGSFVEEFIVLQQELEILALGQFVGPLGQFALASGFCGLELNLVFQHLLSGLLYHKLEEFSGVPCLNPEEVQMAEQLVYQCLLLVFLQVHWKQVREVLPGISIESPGQFDFHFIQLFLRFIFLALSVLALRRTPAVFITLHPLLQVFALALPGLGVDLGFTKLINRNGGITTNAFLVTARDYLRLEYVFDVVDSLFVEISVLQDGNVLVDGVVEPGLQRIAWVSLHILLELSPIGDEKVEVLELVVFEAFDLLDEDVAVVSEEVLVIVVGEEREDSVDELLDFIDEVREVNVEGVLDVGGDALK